MRVRPRVSRRSATTVLALALGLAGSVVFAQGNPSSAAPKPPAAPSSTAAPRARILDPRAQRAGLPATPAASAAVAAQPPSTPALPDPNQAAAAAISAASPISGPLEGGESLSLQAALYGAISGNPDLMTLRNNNIATPESVEVARRFPTTLNPTLWVDIRPWTAGPGNSTGKWGPQQALLYFSYRQPIEMGHQTKHRYEIAKAAYSQQQWTVVQAELLTMVQTYRFFQTAAYRREKLRVARALADFNDRLVGSLKRRLEESLTSAADVALAEVESQATRQQAEVARQDYLNALTDLRNQIGLPDTANTAEPLGEFVLPTNIPPIDDQALIQLALCSRPEIHAARAAVAGAGSSIKLAQGDRIPTPVVGPIYERDQSGVQYFGFVYITPIPVINNGMPLVRQREADYRRAVTVLQQAEQRTVTQVKAAVAKWNAANRLVTQTNGLIGSLRTQVEKMERLFEANQADITKLLQARQRLIQLENADLDALWQATQAQADLLTALGAPGLIAALQAPNPTAAPTPAPAPAR